ncbi:aminotransferase class I/II-fold pyridoxal phosphate-dependent enzyme [Sedimentibacter sp. zth1]|uniref:pyridoxal phosphate-dependent aminotransferase n=1 Tax=Sedimentibacter sp. zth1 TaxID=2816908 RepID=UPI001A92FB9B|nr:histidinol-phosphate transaminase [Sedimentibacter sp. zth1]QSX06339.1 aminotransferase class I/II-fold pyridoxal phosphate-dependent enzyme [Sedimentibacter sp. zth1]
MNKNSHGADIYTEATTHKINQNDIIDFSSNINPFGFPKSVKFSIIEALEYAHRYPDVNCRELRKSLSNYENVNEKYIYCSNGAIESIFRLVNFLKPKNALILAPTFSEYEQALKSEKCSVNYYNLTEENNFLIKDDILDFIDDNTDILFICNPNNPTGQLTSYDMLKKIIEHSKRTGTIVVLDECFIEFVDNYQEYSVKDLLDEYNNLIIVKAFTKIYAMAGIRLGYCLCRNEQILNGIKKSGPVWNVSTIAQVAGVAAIKETKYVENSLIYIKAQRQYLYNELINLGFNVYAPSANYIFFKSQYNCNLKEELMKNGMLIRSCGNYEGLDNRYYRVAVKMENENKKLISGLKEILDK